MQTWEVLLKRAIRQIEAAKLPDSAWCFGGGTVLMLEYNHRESKDIDIFINDRQLLTFLSPRLNDALEAEVGKYTEQSNFVRLYFPEGEIDFIAARPVTDIQPQSRFLCGRNVQTEHPVEIVAKKVYFRADEFKARDVFDMAMVFYRDRNVMASYAKSFAPFLHILENRIEALQQSGELQQALADIAVLPGSKQIYGQEYHFCKLFFWKLKQLSQVHKHEQAASPKRGFKL